MKEGRVSQAEAWLSLECRASDHTLSARLINQSELQGKFTAHVANLEVDPGMLHAEMSTRTVGIAKWRAADESCAKSRGLDMQNGLL